MSTLKYLLQFQTSGLGNVRQASAAINQVTNSAGNGGAAKVEGLSRALQGMARIGGLGPLAEMSHHLENIYKTAGRASGGLGSMLRIGSVVGIAVAAYSALKDKIAEVSREIDKQIESTNRLSRATNDTLSDGRKGLGKIESTEDRQAFVDDLEGKKKKLTRELADNLNKEGRTKGDSQDAAQMRNELNVLNRLLEQAEKMDLKTQAQIESFKKSQADSQSRADIVVEAGRDRSGRKDQFGFEKSMADTPDTEEGAKQRIGLILARQEELQGRNNRKGAEIVGATSNGSPEELSRLMQERADIEGEQNRLTLALIDENKKIDDEVAKAKKEELKTATQTAKEAARERKQIAKEMLKDVRGRFDDKNLPQADSLAKRGIFVDGGGKNEAVRWAKASADALGKLVALISKQSGLKQAGAAAWGE